MTLTPWQNFYVILGSAAGALVGLQFVAMALIADISFRPDEQRSTQEEASAAFATPTVVRLTGVLVLAAAMVMPWPRPVGGVFSGAACASAALGLCYMVATIRRMARHTAYTPVGEDWIFRAALPTLAYLGLLTSGVFATLPSIPHPTRILFGIAFSALLLLVMGIHNAWDNVTYIVGMKRNRS